MRTALAISGLLAAPSTFALDAAQVYERRAPSIWVVNVSDAQGRPTRMGSAVVIAPETLVTNCHVLVGGKSIVVKRENTAHGAKLQHADVDRDLCILRVAGLVAPAVPMAPTSALKVGEKVYAIGAPRSLELTLSDGLLAGLQRDAQERIIRLQISAPISAGSSGGGVFDADGRLIGVTYMTVRDAQNLNFAIPAAWIDEVPTRARIALDKFRAEQASATAGNGEVHADTSATPHGESRQTLTGDELRRHVEALRNINATAPSGTILEFKFSGIGSFGVTNTRTHAYSSGSLRLLADSSEVCFQMGNPKFSGMQTCYRLSHAGDTFTMRSVSSNYYFKYPGNGS